MDCNYFSSSCQKAGRQRNGAQKWFCKSCGKYQQEKYKNKACHPNINLEIKKQLKESCGIRSISRLLEISITTVTKRILSISKSVKRPYISMGKTYEMDELQTYVLKKKQVDLGCLRHPEGYQRGG